MIARPFWQSRIEEAWRETPIAWLCGVRRSGKTTLAESLGSERALLVNCDLPAVEEWVRDPEAFYRSYGRLQVRIGPPSELREGGASPHDHARA